jgi:hypothetical protein
MEEDEKRTECKDRETIVLLNVWRLWLGLRKRNGRKRTLERRAGSWKLGRIVSTRKAGTDRSEIDEKGDCKLLGSPRAAMDTASTSK